MKTGSVGNYNALSLSLWILFDISAVYLVLFLFLFFEDSNGIGVSSTSRLLSSDRQYSIDC